MISQWTFRRILPHCVCLYNQVSRFLRDFHSVCLNIDEALRFYSARTRWSKKFRFEFRAHLVYVDKCYHVYTVSFSCGTLLSIQRPREITHGIQNRVAHRRRVACVHLQDSLTRGPALAQVNSWTLHRGFVSPVLALTAARERRTKIR